MRGSVECYFPASAVKFKKQKTTKKPKTDPAEGMKAIVGLASKKSSDCF